MCSLGARMPPPRVSPHQALHVPLAQHAPHSPSANQSTLPSHPHTDPASRPHPAPPAQPPSPTRVVVAVDDHHADGAHPRGAVGVKPHAVGDALAEEAQLVRRDGVAPVVAAAPMRGRAGRVQG